MSYDERREEKLRVFQRLHNPDGTLYHLAHARRANKSEPYDGAKLRTIYNRVVDRHVHIARRVLELLRIRTPRARG